MPCKVPQSKLPAEMTPAANKLELTLEELAEQCKTGDLHAFESLVQRLESRVTFFLYRMVGNMDDAADLAQDSFVKAYKNIHRYDSKYSFTTWLFTIAKRTAYNYFRSAKPTVEFQDYAELEEAHPRSLLESKDETETLWATAKRVLKPLQFEALWLRYGEDLTIEETAHVMKTNQIRVRVLVHRARGILVRHVKNESKGGIQ